MRRALVIGIQNYHNGYSTAISPAVGGDVELFVRLLSQIGIVDVDRLGGKSESVGYTQLKESIDSFLINGSPSDDLIVYYSGHGRFLNGTTYLVPSEANPNALEPQSYLVPLQFQAAIRGSRARSITFLIDACRDGDSAGESVDLVPPPQGRPTSFILASRPAEAARTISGESPASVFTKALYEIVPVLTPDTRLSRAQEVLQVRVAELATTEGLAIQQLEVVANVEVSTAPFPLFAVGVIKDANDRWSRLFPRSVLQDYSSVSRGYPLDRQRDAIDGATQDRLMAVIDKLEQEAPQLMDGSTASPWREPGLCDRLARASLEIAPDGLRSQVDRLLLIGLLGTLEAGFRFAEHELIEKPAEQNSISAVLNSDPALRRAVGEWGEESSIEVRMWVAHVASIRECLYGQPQILLQRIGSIVGVAFPTLDPMTHKHATNLLMQVARASFDSSVSIDDLDPPLELDANRPDLVIGGRRLAGMLKLVWHLSLDSRLFAPEAGLHLVDDEVDLRETLGVLNSAAWARMGNLLDLRLWTRSAALDKALRDLASMASDLFLRFTQPGTPFYETGLPLALATSRLAPEEGAYRLPHIAFRVSASETQALLMGTNLYGDASLAIRELYQNSADACHYRRARIDHVSQGMSHQWSPRIEFRTGSANGSRFVDCMDNGIGMSDFELSEAFAKAGRRFRDLPEYIEESAEWRSNRESGFMPISQFGIGVLSYFMIAERLELWTTRSDRNLRLGTPLHVTVHGGGGLFRVAACQAVGPPGGGTLMRLHLRRDLQDFDIETALKNILSAPTVDVAFYDAGRRFEWMAGRLYRDGDEVVPCYAASDLGVFFHSGVGRVLVNGIPVSVPDPKAGFRTREGWLSDFSGTEWEEVRVADSQVAGLTVSLDGRVKPEMTVDRRTLLSFNRAHARDLVDAAASRIADWDGLSINWLVELFASEKRSARVAYEIARTRDLPLTVRRSRDKAPDARSEYTTFSRCLERDGVYYEDLLPADAVPQTLIGTARKGWLTGGKAGRATSYSRAGFPKQDHRLAMVMSGPGGILSGEKARSTDFVWPWFRRSHHLIDFGSSQTRVSADLKLKEAQELSEECGTTLGALANYLWAVSLIESPVTMWIPGALAFISSTSSPDQWAQLCERWGGQSVLTGVRDEIPIPAAIRAPASSEKHDFVADPFFDMLVLLGAMSPSPSEAPMAEAIASQRQYAQPDEGWSAGARLALSEDLDSESPWHTEFVPAINVAVASDRFDQRPEDIVSELRRRGMSVRPERCDWDRATGKIDLALSLLEDTMVSIDEDGRLDIRGLDDLVEILEDYASTAGFKRFISAVVSSGFAGPILTALDAADLPPLERLKRHSTVLNRSDDAGLLLEVPELVGIAGTDGDSLKYGDALAVVRSYGWLGSASTLPQSLPKEIASSKPTKTQMRYFCDARWSFGRGSAAEVAVRAVRLAALHGKSLLDVANELKELLAVSNYDSDLLRHLCSIVPGKVDFDDLLILGTKQFLDISFSDEETAAICRPFANDPDSVRAKAKLWRDVSLRLEAG